MLLGREALTFHPIHSPCTEYCRPASTVLACDSHAASEATFLLDSYLDLDP